MGELKTYKWSGFQLQQIDIEDTLENLHQRGVRIDYLDISYNSDIT